MALTGPEVSALPCKLIYSYSIVCENYRFCQWKFKHLRQIMGKLANLHGMAGKVRSGFYRIVYLHKNGILYKIREYESKHKAN